MKKLFVTSLAACTSFLPLPFWQTLFVVWKRKTQEMQIQISIYGRRSAIQLSIFLHFNESISGFQAKGRNKATKKKKKSKTVSNNLNTVRYLLTISEMLNIYFDSRSAREKNILNDFFHSLSYRKAFFIFKMHNNCCSFVFFYCTDCFSGDHWCRIDFFFVFCNHGKSFPFFPRLPWLSEVVCRRHCLRRPKEKREKNCKNLFSKTKVVFQNFCSIPNDLWIFYASLLWCNILKPCFAFAFLPL